ncbi:MAG: flagellar type III secretion system pore protein FliP [Planctomycetota bacterium]
MSRTRLALILLTFLACASPALAQESSEFGGQEESAPATGGSAQKSEPGEKPSLISIQFQDGQETGDTVASAVSILFLLTSLTLIPALLLTLTSFTRIVIVLSFVRRAVGIQELPPNTIMTGMALFLTLCVMSPTLEAIYDQALGPYLEGELGMSDALKKAEPPLREFLGSHVQDQDAELFSQITNLQREPSSDALESSLPKAEELPLTVLIPAFVLSEVRVGFQMGFVIFLPFLVIDLVIASVLISMGMFMLPPVVISTPLKILLFVLVDGWSLLIGSIVRSFAV